jgi:hypothetical protein
MSYVEISDVVIIITFRFLYSVSINAAGVSELLQPSAVAVLSTNFKICVILTHRPYITSCL